MNREEIIRRDGKNFPGTSYTNAVLRPAYDEAKRKLLPAMMQIHRAHLLMLHECGILSKSDATTIAGALNRIDVAALANSEYTGEDEDLFFTLERELRNLGGEITGSLHTARSRNDMGVTLYRMVAREELLRVISTAIALYETLVALGEEHAETLNLEHTHTQPAQPSTLGHRFLAIADVLGRDIVRMQQAYAALDFSPMGAAALTGTGFPINREKMAGLLGFRGLVENSYDAIAATDYLAQAALAVQLMAVDTGRSCVDFLTWCTAEFGLYRVADPYVQISSIMPQKRNPVSLEHSRSLLSAASASAATVLTMMHNTPFGDLVDTEDDMQPYFWRATHTLSEVLQLLTGVLGTIQVNKELMRQRALASFANATELADTLVRQAGLTFTQAHRVVSRLVREADEVGIRDVRELKPERVLELSQEVSGDSVFLTLDEIAKALDADNFVTVRTSRGGAAPAEVTRMAKERKGSGEEFSSWYNQQLTHLAGTAEALLEATDALFSA